ncbi:hypothetical protein PQR07_06945 [Paraburkholderia aspalathi]
MFERYKARHIELARSDADGAVRVDVSPDLKTDPGPGPNPNFGSEGSPGVGTGTNADLTDAALTLERYRDTQRRYWMDR